MTFRQRILLAMLPLVRPAGRAGGTGAVLIYHLGHQIDQILRENYDSVIYMRDLNEALERIDSSFQFALAGREKKSFQQYQDEWKSFDAEPRKESKQHHLARRGRTGRQADQDERRLSPAGDEFFAHPEAKRDRALFRPRATGRACTTASCKSRRSPTASGKSTRTTWRRPTRRPAAWPAPPWSGTAAAWPSASPWPSSSWPARSAPFSYPIRAVTESAAAIGAGNLDQLVPIISGDELGQLASSFNNMARQLRDLRQSHHAQLIRAQQTSQATIDSFPDPVLVVDPRQRVEMANPAARRLLGVRPARTAAARPRSGSRPRPCGSRCWARWRSSRSICPRASTRPSCCNWASSPIPSFPASCPSAIRRARRWGRRCCWRTSRGSACWTR